MRLKCEAYSTLNEGDEDPNLEGRVSEKLGNPHPHTLKVGLVDPAALYLTAILELVLFFLSAILLEAYHLCYRAICECVATSIYLPFFFKTSINFRHVLSNVGRVVARDSSRAIATVNDLFVALCEDVSIYGLFKTMKGPRLLVTTFISLH